MKKRILSMCLIVALAIPCMVIPAGAVSTYGPDGVYDSYEEGIFDYVSYYLGDIYLWVKETYSLLEDYLWDIYDIIDKVRVQVVYAVNDLKATVMNVREDLTAWQADLKNQLSLFEAGMHQAFNVLSTSISNYLTSLGNTITSKIGEFKTSFDSYVTSVLDRITQFKDSVVEQFTSLGEKIDTLVHGNADDQQKADEYQDEVNKQETQFDEYEDVMSTAPTVDIDGADNVLLEVFKPDLADSQYTAILGGIMNVSPVYMPLMISLGMAVIGFLLHGQVF